MPRNILRLLAVFVVAFGTAAAQAPASLGVPTTGSMVVGALALDGVAHGALVAGGDGVAFHTFWFDVPAGVTRWTLTLDADVDLDLAAKAGAEIGTYADRDRGGDWDYRDIETRNPTVLAIDAPRAGRWYVDVFNALAPGTRGAYRLTSTVASTASAPTAPGALPGKLGPAEPVAPPPSVPIVTAPTSEPAIVGALPLEGIAQGALVATSGGNAFHTYWVEVPAGVGRWTLHLEADADLDLAVKFGSEIQNYADRDRGGDWDARDIETADPTVIAFDAPRAGRWYVDVFSLLQPGTRASYRLTSTAGAAPSASAATPVAPVGPTGPALPPAMAGPGAAPAAGSFTGSFRLRDGDVTLELGQDAGGQVRGTLAGSGTSLTVEGVTDADGTYGVIYDDQGGVFFSAVATGQGLELTLYDADAQGEPIASSARTLVFDRTGARPSAPPTGLPVAPPGGGALPAPPTTTIAPPESGAIHDARSGLTLAAGDRVRYPYAGASLAIPPGWQAWVADERLLPLYVASQSQPGLAVVLTTHGVSLAQFAQALAEQIEFEDGSLLRPVGAPQAAGDQVSVRYAAAGGVGVGVARTAGAAGAILLYLGGAGQEAVGAELLGALAASLRFEPPAAAAELERLERDWRGYRMWTYHYGGAVGSAARTAGEFEAHWDLCADGRFLQESRSERATIAGAAADTGLSLGVQFFGSVDAGSWSGRGRWTFAAIGDRPVLLLFDDAGSWSYYEVSWSNDGSYRLDEFWLERRAAGGC